MQFFLLVAFFFLTACSNIAPQLPTNKDKAVSNHIQKNKEEARLAQLEYERLKNERENI
jgi:outer membrane biogenesis lipoprotein LolB